MVVIGVTGGIGTGKSTVAGMFRKLGASVLDADAITHKLMEPRKLAWRRIVSAFGEDVLNADQTVNRRKLAGIVFADDELRRRLEAILHPGVMREIRRQVHGLGRSKRVKAAVLDVPLLVEVGAQDLADALVVVTAPRDVQRERLKKQHGWTDDEIEARIRAQWDLSAKAALADHVVDNGNGVDRTRTQVTRLWRILVPASSKRS
jgi:dephospho-CoA kinase